jgi:hypothetical protein
MGFIEKSFLKITQMLGLLLTIVVFVMVVIFGYDKINITDEKKVVPIIQFADYQKMTLTQEKDIAKNLSNNQNFNQAFNKYVNDIVGALNNLSDKVVSKENLQQKVKISSKVKTSQYPQSVQLSYVQSLAKLTNQVATVGAKVNINELTRWHDQSFFKQIQAKNKANFLQIGSVRIARSAYSALWEALAIFAMLVIMLAVLRIEKNTRDLCINKDD